MIKLSLTVAFSFLLVTGTGCLSVARYAHRPPTNLVPPETYVDSVKPDPIWDQAKLDALDIDQYLQKSIEKELEQQDLSSVKAAETHPLTMAIAQWMGTRYRYGGKSRKGIDCSGFVNEVFSSLGIQIPRNSRDIAKLGDTIGRDSLRYGDILTFARRKGRIHHVGIYLGEDRFAHASRKGVTVSTIATGYWAKRYVGARRIDIPNIQQAIPPVPGKIEEGGDPMEEGENASRGGAN